MPLHAFPLAREYSCDYAHGDRDLPNARVRLLFSGGRTIILVDRVREKQIWSQYVLGSSPRNRSAK